MTRPSLIPSADYDRALAQRDHANAHCDRALEIVRLLVRQLEKIGGYATHEQQAELRDARALLAEGGK